MQFHPTFYIGQHRASIIGCCNVGSSVLEMYPGLEKEVLSSKCQQRVLLQHLTSMHISLFSFYSNQQANFFILLLFKWLKFLFPVLTETYLHTLFLKLSTILRSSRKKILWDSFSQWAQHKLGFENEAECTHTCAAQLLGFYKTATHLNTCHCLFLRKRNEKINFSYFSWQTLRYKTNHYQLK